jgi:hypothetical protein
MGIGVAGSWAAGLWVFFSPLRTMRDFDTHDAYAAKGTAAAVEPEAVATDG